MDYTFQYSFEPVGQGLFAWGCIHQKDDMKLQFTWVYDCGTTSKQDFVIRAIEMYENHLGTRKQIDLLTFSHFDRDHISGMAKLICKFKVGTLLLPYTELKQRLIYAFEHGVGTGSNLMDFYLNPISYLTSLEGPGIDRILIVRSSNGDGPAMPESNPNFPDKGDFPHLKFEIERDEDLEELPSSMANSQPTPGKSTIVEYLRRGSNLQLPNLWEFVPYNEERKEAISKEFDAAIVEARDVLLAPQSAENREISLGKLKEIYDKEFGDGSYERNVISLSLFSGPIYSSWTQVQLRHWFPLNFNRYVIRARFWQNVPSNQNRCSLLYTGDGYLDTPYRLDSFVDFFKNDRVQTTGVFQVMHHGSSKNWHKGVADRISPMFSIFSSDPENRKYEHPDADVLHDFWRYGSIQVDKQVGFHIAGCLKR